MRAYRKFIIALTYALAAAYGLWRGIRIAFFPIAMRATVPATGGPETIAPAFMPERWIIFAVIVFGYALIGSTLYLRAISAFRMLCIIHIVVSLLSLPSVGSLFLPSSALLLIATLLSISLGDEQL